MGGCVCRSSRRYSLCSAAYNAAGWPSLDAGTQNERFDLTYQSPLDSYPLHWPLGLPDCGA